MAAPPIGSAAPAASIVVIALALALVLTGSFAKARGWLGKLRAMREFRARSRQRRRILAALDMIDALVCHLDGNVHNAAQVRASLARVRELTAAAQLADRNALEDLLSPPRTNRRPRRR